MTKGIIALSFEFIEKHILGIISVVIFLFVVTIYKVLNNITYHKSHPVLQRVVVVENLANPTSDKISQLENQAQAKSADVKSSQKDAICNGDLETKNAACKQMSTQNSCNTHNCCVWAKKNKTFACLGGDSSGPTYDGGKYDEYYYVNKKFSNN